MSETYCGKSCSECTYKESLACSGCHEGLGKPIDGECRIARCCRGRGRTSCEGCTPGQTCLLLPNRDSVPKDILSQRAEKHQLAIRLQEIVPRMSILLIVYSVLLIVGELIIELTPLISEYITLPPKTLQTTLTLLRSIPYILYTIPLFLMAFSSKNYLYAALASLANAVLLIIQECFGVSIFILNNILILVWMYFGLAGHTELVNGVNRFSYFVWDFFRKYMPICFIAVYLLRVLGIFPIITVGLMIVVVLFNFAHPIFLFHTAQLLRESAIQAQSENER